MRADRDKYESCQEPLWYRMLLFLPTGKGAEHIVVVIVVVVVVVVV